MKIVVKVSIFEQIKFMTKKIIDGLHIILFRGCKLKKYWFFIQSLIHKYPNKDNYHKVMNFDNSFGYPTVPRLNYGYY